MSDDLQAWFKDLPDELERDVAKEFRDLVEDFKEEVKAEAPEGPTGNTKASVRVTETDDPLRVFIDAGGSLTTKEVRKGSGTAYDYALGEEFGNSHVPARPWFYPTYRARREAWAKQLQDLAANKIANS